MNEKPNAVHPDRETNIERLNSSIGKIAEHATNKSIINKPAEHKAKIARLTIFLDELIQDFEAGLIFVEDFDQEQVEKLLSFLEKKTEKAAPMPRVLITVNGGVADYICDEGVDIEVFDFDNYNADRDHTSLVPAHFSDLAKHVGAPVEVAEIKAPEFNARGME